MAGRISAFLKNACSNEPVLAVSFSVWGLAVIMPMISPYTKYSDMINKITPYNYPVPDVPSHPQDPLGLSLEWLKNCECFM
ncbi:NADH dehydrogenase [ubiquinone] 1 alpha subcomplex subunit 3-like [Apodemus sylvaticus]|uniref:NADH dehydrogenase [ubiquinone] 1 alpha subcomplex subunit 3-like n=1 Tax=Apodemus sylvaticus TaxID=10129 RepID=UPI002244612B|nr:NADH dehydrogenase [ubiquinone] 1 alpha subcomplex subunit 3-like [Apodemus sylvaticus]